MHFKFSFAFWKPYWRDLNGRNIDIYGNNYFWQLQITKIFSLKHIMYCPRHHFYKVLPSFTWPDATPLNFKFSDGKVIAGKLTPTFSKNCQSNANRTFFPFFPFYFCISNFHLRFESRTDEASMVETSTSTAITIFGSYK